MNKMLLEIWMHVLLFIPLQYLGVYTNSESVIIKTCGIQSSAETSAKWKRLRDTSVSGQLPYRECETNKQVVCLQSCISDLLCKGMSCVEASSGSSVDCQFYQQSSNASFIEQVGTTLYFEDVCSKSNNCQNGEMCVNSLGTSLCDVDNCMPNPCGSGSSCTDGINRYTCSCIVCGTPCYSEPWQSPVGWDTIAPSTYFDFEDGSCWSGNNLTPGVNGSGLVLNETGTTVSQPWLSISCFVKADECISGFTLAFWIYADQGMSGYNGFITSKNNGASNGGLLIYYQAGTMRFKYYTTTAQLNCPTISTTLQWYHVVLVYWRNPESMKMYKNLVSLGGCSYDNTTGKPNFGNNLRLGTFYTDQDSHLGNGMLDEVLAWDEPLADTQVSMLL